MPQRTPQRSTTGTSRIPRSAATGRGGRPSRQSPTSGAGRFARTSTPSPGPRFGRPAPARTKKRSSSGGGLTGLLGGLTGSKGKSSGGGIGKSAGGLAALAGLAGLAMKNRSKITGRLGGKKEFEPEVVAPATPPATDLDTGPTA